MAGISLWLVPSETETTLLQRFMDRHPEPGARHSFPRFHPHVTLATIQPPSEYFPPGTTRAVHVHVHDSALLTLREAVPLGQTVVPVRFARVVSGEHYFRSIYVALAPSPELVGLRAALGAAGTPHPPAFPHLSLYYIADEEAHTRTRFLQELERENVVRPSADGQGVILDCDGSIESIVAPANAVRFLEGFMGTEIWIVDCEGPVEGWKVLDKILLAKSDH
ncbi:2',3'-cyclic-nucleotide 3'-phosphodiesterase [Multifurca ochricompacta]|uniref:2',3'-cyclic-nucleotide 3'-phosphodiesterase n=1 Tax=Multifurca ochricompacta TaxID=376703 RepID=A0AAD4QRV5_9AGAM|nr:2',3'-cyclic-nucleotide 3'-phosphodiesterase [Multifurca ochricompacta]